MVATLTPSGLEVTTTSGSVLDAQAAQVLTSLGGATPPWLATVEGLQAAWHYRLDPRDLSAAATALDQSDGTQSRLAVSSNDVGALVGLAAAGVATVAINPQCPAAAWDLLRLHPDESVRSRALATVRTLPPELATHPDPVTRALAARNLSCTPRQLEDLADDTEYGVVLAVAGNTSTPRRVLRRLASRRETAIRVAVAGNTAFPIRTIATEWLMTRTPATLVSFAGRTDASGFFLHRVEGIARKRRGFYRPVLLALQRNSATPKRLQATVQRRLQGKRRKFGGVAGVILGIFAVSLLVMYVAGDDASGQGSNLGNSTLIVPVLCGLAWRLTRPYYRRWRRSRRASQGAK
jgi:hypothetical protein